MKIINLQQNTPEWKQYRKTKIGASDFAAFCCHKEISEPIFKTSIQSNIYNKINNIEINNIFMQAGKDAEAGLLNYFNQEYHYCCMPTVVEHNNPTIFASLDGYDIFNIIGLEIKTTNKPIDMIPKLEQYYKYQLLHQMICANLKQIYFLVHSFSDKCTHVKIVHRQDIKMSDTEHLILCNEYLNMLNHQTIDEEIAMLHQYRILDEDIKEKKQLKKMLFEQIINKISPGIYNEFIIKETEKNTISYADIVKDYQIAIDNKYIKTHKNVAIKWKK